MNTALPKRWMLKRSTPGLPDGIWNALDLELCQLQGQLNHNLGHDIIPAHCMADQNGSFLTNFFSSKKEFREEIKVYFHYPPVNWLEDARKAKNVLGKKAKRYGAIISDKKQFSQALKYYIFLLIKTK